VGVKVDLTEMPEDTKEDDLINFIEKLNNDSSVHGILVELPLPKHIAKEKVMNAILPVKDVDGVTAVNRGYIFGGQDDLALVPATPMSCIELIERSGIELKGKRVALVGRGDTVGRPLASLLITRHATITVCHTRTVDMAAVTKNAEIVVAAAGRKDLVMKRVGYWKQIFLQKIKDRSIDVLVPCGMNKKLEEYKNVNDCIKGMMLYNMLTNSNTFKPGTKGYKVYVKSIRFDKLGMSVNEYGSIIKSFIQAYGIKDKKRATSTIVIPIESKTIPEWIEIDVHTTMDKIFYSRVNELLQGMDIVIGEKQQVSIDDLF